MSLTKTSAPLISVGIPTYNRPQLLARALQSVLDQTYDNLEIIVSDNCTEGVPGEEVRKVIEEFVSFDKRITFFKQKNNIGPLKNYFFLLSKFSSPYYIVLADDDYWGSADFLQTLFPYVKSNALVFSDIKLISGNGVGCMPYFSKCKTTFEFSLEYCKQSAGYPFYGLYNKVILENLNIKPQEYCLDIPYYGEGLFLHKIFSTAPVAFSESCHLMVTSGSSIPSNDVRMHSFLEYSRRVIDFYYTQNLQEQKKSILFMEIMRAHAQHFSELLDIDSHVIGDTISIQNDISAKCLTRVVVARFLKILVDPFVKKQG